jgi:nitrile hydratase subunit alpha
MAFPVTMKAAKHDHEHQAVPSDLALRVKALESLLVEKGLIDPAARGDLQVKARV